MPNISIMSYYEAILNEYSFVSLSDKSSYRSTGKTWRLNDTAGSGNYWVYEQSDYFNIKIHDFFFYEDTLLKTMIPECLSITYYESISGEELYPYRRLNAGCIKAIIGSNQEYRALIHKNIPIRSIGIEIMPSYYEDYLKKQFPEEYTNPKYAFFSLDQTMVFPEMVFLLNQVRDYHGDGMAAKLFYESKMTEAISLVVEYQRKNYSSNTRKISSEDVKNIELATAYLNDHSTSDVPLDCLAKIACMSLSKFKYSFKQVNKCSVTEYIQNRRMSQAECLLSNTDLSISNIARSVGYSNPSRFSELFKKSTGLLPGMYRKMANRTNR